MAERWLGVPAAAEALGISASEVRARIAEETLTVRTGEAGLEVLVTVPDAPTPASPGPVEAGRETVFEAMLATASQEEEWEAARRPRYDASPRRGPAAFSSAVPAALRGEPADADTEAADDLGDELLPPSVADMTRERLAHSRAESSRLRAVNRFAIGGVCVTLIAGVLFTTAFAREASRAEGALQAHQGLVEQAKADADRALDSELTLKRENAALAERLANLTAERDTAKTQLDEQRRRLTELEVEKRQAETALQAALVSLYQHQPEAARAAVERLRAGAE